MCVCVCVCVCVGGLRGPWVDAVQKSALGTSADYVLCAPGVTAVVVEVVHRRRPHSGIPHVPRGMLA